MIEQHLTLAARLGQVATAQSVKVTVAESCTGGGIANAITATPGASGWFEYGFVTYSNGAKSRLLGVKPETLLKHGAVSQEVVEAMALGALDKSAAQYAVAVSGIAGPTGSTPTKPVGLVWFAWAGPGFLHSAHHILNGGREGVRSQAVSVALEQLAASIQKNTV